MFSSAGYSESDLLFSDSTHHLLRVLGSYTSWLGPTYTTALQAFECEGKTDGRIDRHTDIMKGRHTHRHTERDTDRHRL